MWVIAVFLKAGAIAALITVGLFILVQVVPIQYAGPFDPSSWIPGSPAGWLIQFGAVFLFTFVALAMERRRERIIKARGPWQPMEKWPYRVQESRRFRSTCQRLSIDRSRLVKECVDSFLRENAHTIYAGPRAPRGSPTVIAEPSQSGIFFGMKKLRQWAPFPFSASVRPDPDRQLRTFEFQVFDDAAWLLDELKQLENL